MSLLCLAALLLAQETDFSRFQPYLPTSGEGEYIIHPEYHDAPELTKRDGIPHGQFFRFVMDSTTSRIYPGIAKDQPLKIVPYHRAVHVYIPAQYKPGTEAKLIVSQDSMGRGELPTILDNMIADHRLPPIVAVMLDSGGNDSLGSERGLEYDTLSPRYADYIEQEVLPEVSKRYNVTFSKNPDDRMAMGGSSGAACAFSMAWYHNDLYHRVLLYSGTFVNQQWPYDPATPHGAWEYHDHLIPETKRKPIRIWMEVGDHDIRFNDPESTYHNWVMANNRFATRLKQKGYHYQYVYATDASHVDWRVVKQTLAQALEFVWKGNRVR